MLIIFRSLHHNPYEIIMGQFIWFYPCDGVDAISVTANPEGFTTQNRVGQLLGYTQDEMVVAANECNLRFEIAILNKSTPSLLLVPQTRGKKDSSFLVQDLVSACNKLDVKNLHFTHYGFIQNKLSESEFIEIFTFMMNPLTQNTLRSIIWDIDVRAKSDLKSIYQNLSNQLPRSHEKAIWL